LSFTTSPEGVLLKKMNTNKGITFISVLIAVFVMAVGLTALLKAYPLIGRLSERARSYVSVSLVADKVFAVIENVYGDAGGPAVPESFAGIDEEFPGYSYSASIEEEKKGLYAVNVEISWRREGKIESESFFGRFRRK